MATPGSLPEFGKFGKLNTVNKQGTPIPTGDTSTVKFKALTSKVLQDKLSGTETQSRDLLKYHNLGKEDKKAPSKPPAKPPHGRPPMLRGDQKLAQRGASIYAFGKDNDLANYLRMAPNNCCSHTSVPTLSTMLAGNSCAPMVVYTNGNSNNDLHDLEKLSTIANSFGGGQNFANFCSSIIGGLFGGGSTDNISSSMATLGSNTDQIIAAAKNNPQLRQQAQAELQKIEKEYTNLAQDLVKKESVAEQNVTTSETAYKEAQTKTKGINDNISQLEGKLGKASTEEEKEQINKQITELKKSLQEAQNAETKAKEALAKAQEEFNKIQQQALALSQEISQFYRKASQLTQGAGTNTGFNFSA